MKKTSPRSSPLLQFFKSKSKSNNSNVSISRNSSPSGDNNARKSPSNSNNNKSTTTGGGGGDNDSVASSHVSIITKSLSKCFDNGVSMNEAIILNDDEKKNIINSSKNNNNAVHSKSKKDNSGSGASKKESSSSNNNNADGEPHSPSKGSHANNSNSTSNKTDQTTPLTTSTTTGERHYQSQQFAMKTGMTSAAVAAPQTPGSHNISSHATTANTPTTAAMGGTTTSASVITNFWNNHAQPATQCAGGAGAAAEGGGGGGASSPSSPSLHSAVAASPFTTSAKAAADAVIGLISKAENFITTSTGISPSSGGGFCSPRNSPNAMEGIPEGDDEHTDTNNNGLCGNDNHCFEFEDFGFNAFQDNDDDNTNTKNQQQQQQRSIKDEKSIVATSERGGPSQTVTSIPSEQQNKGYEIRLKSTFSQIKAQEDAAKSIDQRKQQPLGAFGRTHPNYKKTISHPSDNSSNNNAFKPQKSQHIFNDVPQGSSRALPDGLPFKELSVPPEIEHSVSELTMRSHGAFERHKYTSDSRRMAYYAVGRTTGDDGNASKSGGNRRCYFTGNPIPYGMPFYAGSVQQGPRTLVVFCLPSALGLPMFSDIQAMDSAHQFSNKAGREKYLASLPEPDTKLLKEMSRRYPEPFDTLPVQVRSPHCWRLFVKFCFFSGLPIAEGEMHYRVKSSVTVLSSPQQNGEEIALSHEVMEAVNGEVSAELLRLPNQKVFDYLKRQYSQQSSKLNDEVFDRKSWELVMSEV